MPSYTLYYFNGRGRAEICRLMFTVAGVQFADKRIEFSEWDTFKSKMACPMLPVLEIDGKTQIPQSMAIARYLAREFGFHGKTNLEMARIDYICDCFYELFHDYMRMYHEKNGKHRHELHHRFVQTCLRVLPFLEKTLTSQNKGSEFFMGTEIKMCDMMCYCALENPLKENPNLLKEFPKLNALRGRVATHPKISTYFSKRLKTDF